MKICFVTDGLLGLFENGEIGSSTTRMALEAARAGHATEVLFVQLPRTDLAWSRPHWERIYRDNKIKIINLPNRPYDVSPPYAKASLCVYEYLRHRFFDKIIFSDFGAPGWACHNAKAQGQDFLKTDLIQILHGSLGWRNEANGHFIDPLHNNTSRDFTLRELEKQSYQLADINVSPSQQMLDWTQSRWGKANTRLIPYVMGDSSDIHAHEMWRNFLQEPILAVKPEPTRQPKVSVIIPTFNRPAHLRQLLESLSQQTYKNFEVIIVDDGSTDPEAIALFEKIEARSKTFPLKLLRQQNKYVGAARNYGVRQSTGDYIIFVDDDNLLVNETIQKLVKAIEYSESDILTTFLQEGKGLELPEVSQMKYGYSTLMIGPVELGMVQNVFGDAMGIYRRTVLEKLRFHEWHGVTHEDWDLLARASLAGYKVGRVAEALFWYRVQPECMTKRTSRYQNMQVIDRTYAEVLPSGLQNLPHLVIALAEEVRVLREEIAKRPATLFGMIEKSFYEKFNDIFC